MYHSHVLHGPVRMITQAFTEALDGPVQKVRTSTASERLKCIHVFMELHLSQFAHGITQCHMTPNTSEHIPPREIGTRFTYQGRSCYSNLII